MPAYVSFLASLDHDLAGDGALLKILMTAVRGTVRTTYAHLLTTQYIVLNIVGVPYVRDG